MTTIVATTPGQMQEAQAQTRQWVDAKIESATRELATANETETALRKIGLSTASAQRLVRLARKRLLFYNKVKSALAAGYVIIPPFAVQAFAIRVDDSTHNPSEQKSEYSRRGYHTEQTPDVLPVGHGTFVSPLPQRGYLATETRNKGTPQERSVSLYHNTGWLKPDIPVLAHMPQLLNVTAKALGEKIFDVLGIAPAYRSADPIIVGQINHWREGRNPVTFFVAWWLDEDDL